MANPAYPRWRDWRKCVGGNGENYIDANSPARALDRDDGRLDREAAIIGKARLLVIDELGFLPLDADGARLLFQVLADAYERQSVVFTTNLEFSRCGRCSGTTRWPPP